MVWVAYFIICNSEFVPDVVTNSAEKRGKLDGNHLVRVELFSLVERGQATVVTDPSTAVYCRRLN